MFLEQKIAQLRNQFVYDYTVAPMTTSKSKLTKWLLALIPAGLFCFSSSSVDAASLSKIEYNRDIRPILSQNCFACHGADSAARKAGLRLDRYEDAVAPRKDSATAIIPGKPNESEVMRRILTSDEDDLMPPPDSHKTLTTEQKNLLKRWIADGAKYQAHWSLLPPERVEPPKVKKKKMGEEPNRQFCSRTAGMDSTRRIPVRPYNLQAMDLLWSVCSIRTAQW